jgi:hypothetical protein
MIRPPPEADSPGERAELREFLDKVRRDLGTAALQEHTRFINAPQLLARYDEAVALLFERGWSHLAHVEEVHNELCTAVLVLQGEGEPGCVRLEYEPRLPPCSQRFDFHVTLAGGKEAWVEVKTIHPQRGDRWEDYERHTREGRFPSTASITLDKAWLGGEIYHKYYAARGRMLEHALSTEQAIERCLPVNHGPVFLVFFSNGVDWDDDQLEDFLHFYRFGQHFEGDPFALMEAHFIAEQDISLARNIAHLGYFRRSAGAVLPNKGSWSVKPIQFSPERGYF